MILMNGRSPVRTSRQVRVSDAEVKDSDSSRSVAILARASSASGSAAPRRGGRLLVLARARPRADPASALGPKRRFPDASPAPRASKMDFVPNPNNPNPANAPFNAHSMYQLPPGGFGVGVGPPLPYGGDGAGAGGLAGTLGGGAGLGLNLATNGGTANGALFASAGAGAGDFGGGGGAGGPSRALGGLVSMPVALPPAAPRERSRCQHPGCDKQFAWPQDLRKHVRRFHAGEPPRFACPRDGCGKRFFERKLLVAHERTHTDERPFACPHPGCDKAFRARNALAYHVKALHEAGETHACPEPGCAFVTRRAEALAAHAAGHERRDAAREWRARQKHEVAAAVRSAKRALSEKASELASAEKELARERREHARERKRLETLRARAEATKKTLIAAGAERATRDGKKKGEKKKQSIDSIDDAFVRGAERQGGAKRKARSFAEEEEEEDDSDDGGDDEEEEDSDAELCGVVLPEDDDAPIISVR